MKVSKRKKTINWLLGHPCWSYPISNFTKGKPDNFMYNELKSYDYLVYNDHQNCIYIAHAYVNPHTYAVDSDKKKNTLFRVWLEAGPFMDISKEEFTIIPKGGWTDYNRYQTTHDIYLDCGGATLEKAYLKLAKLVKKHYGEYKTKGSSIDNAIAWHKIHPNGLLREKIDIEIE